MARGSRLIGMRSWGDKLAEAAVNCRLPSAQECWILEEQGESYIPFKHPKPSELSRNPPGFPPFIESGSAAPNAAQQTSIRGNERESP